MVDDNQIGEECWGEKKKSLGRARCKCWLSRHLVVKIVMNPIENPYGGGKISIPNIGPKIKLKKKYFKMS